MALTPAWLAGFVTAAILVAVPLGLFIGALGYGLARLLDAVAGRWRR